MNCLVDFFFASLKVSYNFFAMLLDSSIWFEEHSGSVGRVLDSLVKVFSIIPDFRILRLTFHRKSASKC